MSWQAIAQIAVFFALLTALAPLLGTYMAKVFSGERVWLDRIFGPVERLTYRALRTDPSREQDWKRYARTCLAFSAVSFLGLYAILRLQGRLPGNPTHFVAMPWDVTFNTVASFVTNTNWQFYSGETSMSYLSQMLGLAVQNFVSAAVGIAVLVAMIRGLVRRDGTTIGNFWVDLVRSTLYVLVPLSTVLALVLVSQGVVQTFAGPIHAVTVEGTSQLISRGPAASQIAIKQLGTNGGGFFNTNSAHPFENPSTFSNLLELLAILLIPASLALTYGRMVGRRREGWAIYGAMLVMAVAGTVGVYASQSHPSHAMRAAQITAQAGPNTTGGNLQDAEQRNGVVESSMWANVTTDASNGSVNSGHEAYNGAARAIILSNLMTGEVIFGGVGTGLYTMLMLVLLAVFLAGLMVGRTPEYLGKKIGAKEIKLVLIGTLVPTLLALVVVALSVGTHYGAESTCSHDPRGFSETLYAYVSQVQNNGSAAACYTGFVQPSIGNAGSHGVSFVTLLGGILMLLGRFVPIVAALGIGGALVGKKVAAPGPGTMRTSTPTFAGLLVGVVLLLALLNWVPALMLGPIAEQLSHHLF